MTHLKRLLPGFLLAGTVWLGGCGRQEDQPTRFARALGGTPAGVPTAIGPIDTGILRDQTAYKPADYEPLEPGPAGGGSGGPKTDAIRNTLTRLGTAAYELDVDTILDSLLPEQVAVIAEDDDYLTTFYDTQETWSTLRSVLEEKLTLPESETRADAALAAALRESLDGALRIDLSDEQNATASLDLSGLELPEEAWTRIGQAMAGVNLFGQQLGAGAIPPGAGGPPAPPQIPNAAAAPAQPAVPTGTVAGLSEDEVRQRLADFRPSVSLRKVDDEWRVVLPLTLSDDQAEFINDGLLVVKDVLADVTERVAQADTVDEQALMQIWTQASMSQMGAIMGLVARIPAFKESIAEAMAADTGVTEEPEEDEEQEASEPDEGDVEERDPNAPPPSTGGGGGRRRRP